jgi:glutathione synthetase
LAEVRVQARLSADRTLYIGEEVVSVVYYRAGYTPNDYPSETEWEARLLLEQSTAVKCPTISYHLTGAKKIQQELARPGVLERFLQDAEAVAALRKCFAGLWSLDGDESETIIEEAIRAPDGFVLKPQREGGGNNIYGEDVASTLSKLRAAGGHGLAAYILMQRIFPAVHTSYLLRGGSWSQKKTISELGIYGAYLRNGDREVMNVCAGHLLRTKVADSNEGGVATGYAVLDSPYLT